MRSICIVAIFSLLSPIISTPLIYVQDEKALDAVDVYDYYKDCTVDIETTLNLANGMVVQFGGTGFFVENDGKKEGHIATAAHVVKVEDDEVTIGGFFGFGGEVVKITSYEYYVSLISKNKKYKAELVGANVYDDKALLKAVDANPADYNVAKLSYDNLKVGEPVYVLGMPYGLSNNFTHGKISALHRYIGLWYVEDFIGTDAPINPGNSGGPLIHSRGKVIGFNDAIFRGADGLGFAVPFTKSDFDYLKNGGNTVLPWFGAEAMLENFARLEPDGNPSLRDMRELYDKTGMDPESLYELAKLTKDRWAVVTEIDETRGLFGMYSPAKLVGIKRGDLITKINGKPVKSGMDIRRMIMNSQLGSFIEVELIRLRYGKARTLSFGVPLYQTVPETSASIFGNSKTISLCKDEKGNYGLYVEVMIEGKPTMAMLSVRVKILKE